MENTNERPPTQKEMIASADQKILEKETKSQLIRDAEDLNRLAEHIQDTPLHEIEGTKPSHAKHRLGIQIIEKDEGSPTFTQKGIEQHIKDQRQRTAAKEAIETIEANMTERNQGKNPFKQQS